MPGSAVLVANPTAQSGRAAPVIERARALLERAGIEHDFLPTEPDGGTVGVVRGAIDERAARVVIAMGGDGTFAEAAKGILASAHAPDTTLALLPTGTASGSARRSWPSATATGAGWPTSRSCAPSTATAWSTPVRS